MISGLAELLLALCAVADQRPMLPTEADALVASLAREPPQSIVFRETHTSALLEHPIEVEGTLEYPARGRLVREVSKPYRERIEIDGDDVRVLREGRAERRFALRGNLEFGGMLDVFSGLLAGDRAALERRYDMQAFAGTDGWRIALTPRRPAARGGITGIEVVGAGREPASVRILNRERVVTEIVLGAGAARTCAGPPLEP